MPEYELVTLSAEDVALVRALGYSNGEKTTGGVRAGDDSSETMHVGIRVGDEIVSVGTLNRDPSPRNEHTPVWRIRGMATLKEHRSQGHGGHILRFLIEHVAEAGGGLLWGNLRLAAVPFYERNGFLVHEDVFEMDETDHRYGELLIQRK